MGDDKVILEGELEIRPAMDSYEYEYISDDASVNGEDVVNKIMEMFGIDPKRTMGVGDWEHVDRLGKIRVTIEKL